MKRLSMAVTVLLLASVPLAAAAFDYGPTAPMLAENSGAPTLPGMHAAPGSDASRADMLGAARSDGDRSTGTAGAPSAPSRQHVAPSGTSVPPAQDRAHGDATGRNKTEPPADGHAPATASWQSLLPGSIQ